MMHESKKVQLSEQLFNKGINLNLKESNSNISHNISILGDAILNEVSGSGPCSHTNHSAHASHSKSK